MLLQRTTVHYATKLHISLRGPSAYLHVLPVLDCREVLPYIDHRKIEGSGRRHRWHWRRELCRSAAVVTLDPAVQNIALSGVIRTERLLEKNTFIETDISPHSVRQWFTDSDGLHPIVRINNIWMWSQLVTTLFDTKHIRQNTCFQYWPSSGFFFFYKHHCHINWVSLNVINKDFGNESSISNHIKLRLKILKCGFGDEFRTQMNLSCKKCSITWVKQEKNILRAIKHRKSNRIGYILRGKCLIQDITEKRKDR